MVKGSHETVNKIIGEAIKGMGQLMTNKYGNYFCQKMVQSCSSSQRLELLQNVGHV